MIHIEDGNLKLGITECELDKVMSKQDQASLLAMTIAPVEASGKFCQYCVAKADLSTIMVGLLEYVDRETAIKIVTESCANFLKRVKEKKDNGEVTGSKVSPKDI